MNLFDTFYDNIVTEDETKDREFDILYWATQRKNTDTSYRLQAQDMTKHIEDGDLVVDYGCGLGLGSMYFGNYEYINYEPYPQKGLTPAFTDRSALMNEYAGQCGGVTCNLVINVVDDPKMRIQIIQDVLALLKSGGVGYFVARTIGDVAAAKTKVPYNDGYVMKTPSGGNTFQKGFSTSELRSLVSSLTNNGFKVVRGVGAGSNAKVKVIKL